jgi:hypothetical protein
VKEQEAIDMALAVLERNEDGSIDEKALIDEVAGLLDFDELSERRNRATRALKKRRSPGSTEPEGQLELPTLEPYAYEPRRLIADNEGHVIEQAEAKTRYKTAEAERARDVARRQAYHADRKSIEATHFAQWVIDELGRGRDKADLTFGVFVHEAGVWSAGNAAPEADPEDAA